MTKGMNLLVLAGLILALILNSLFVIDEKEDGIVFQFGEAIKSDLPTGLNFKLPIIQNVKKYDSRLQTLDEEPNRILTCLLYTSPSPRDGLLSRMPSSA